jgi:hypothetical protein
MLVGEAHLRSRLCLVLFALLVSWRPTLAAEIVTTNDFIQMCDAAPDDYCITKFQVASAAANHGAADNAENRHCSPPLEGSTRAERAESLKKRIHVVMLWLEAHPLYGPKSAVESIGAALHALFPYPCK